jgi:hypothetical protein
MEIESGYGFILWDGIDGVDCVDKWNVGSSRAPVSAEMWYAKRDWEFAADIATRCAIVSATISLVSFS